MKSWLRKLLGKEVPTQSSAQAEPSLLQAKSLKDSSIGTVRWSLKNEENLLAVTNGGQTIEWEPRENGPDKHHPCWVPACTGLHLHSGRFRWDFVIDEMASGQIGVGFMLLWDVGPDWGFFGYLGASGL